jgi:hypothetical protein
MTYAYAYMIYAVFAEPAPRRKKVSSSTKCRVRPVAREGGRAAAANAGWADAMSGSNQAEWLVDCYRLRLQDDSDYGGEHLSQLGSTTLVVVVNIITQEA